jgi:formate hydrogenlyase subunit 3/multisubunit Na+/H+ antiporter MnhD subunit
VSILTLVYYLNFQNGVFFGRLESAFNGIKEVPLTMKISMVGLALICAAGGLLLLPGLRPFLQSAADALICAADYKEIISSALQ